jgi:5S rRNA maturation endonuclease (ribonuclease M5)
MIDWNARSNAWANAILKEDRLEDLLGELGCRFHSCSKVGFRGQCPVHGGDGYNFLVREGGDTLPISWVCFSHHCEQEFKPSVLGLVRGALTFMEGKPVGMTQAERWLRQFLGRTPRPGEQGSPIRPQPRVWPTGPSWSREQVRAQLQIPSPYFLARGYDPHILNFMDVGHSAKLGKSIVPLYDDDGQRCIGYYARSELPKCVLCGNCHAVGRACQEGEPRWSVMPGFAKSCHLYNYHRARQWDDFTLLVEGPGDVWRVKESSYQAVALLGTELFDWQVIQLSHCGRHILVVMDNDDAGREAEHRIVNQLNRVRVACAALRIPSQYKDLGEMPKSEVRPWLEAETKPYVQPYYRRLVKYGDEDW